MAIIGCGRLGTAILSGLLAALGRDAASGSNGVKQTEEILPSRFLACIRTAEHGAELETKFSAYTVPNSSPSVDIWRHHNVEAAKQAKVVLLACQPAQLPGILAEQGMANALRGKLVVSICVGIPEAAIQELAFGPSQANGTCHTDSDCHIVHAMPNTASMVGESATILLQRETPLPTSYETMISWMFGTIGTVTKVAPDLMNAASITAGSTPGFLGTSVRLCPVLLGITAGAVSAGLDENTALRMAAQAMKGTAEMVLRLSEKPEEIMDKVATPGGCTERGLQMLLNKEHKGSVPNAFEEAMRAAIARAFELGGGAKNIANTVSK
ncbi:putative pyrroline-5-carboxylate reductase [Thozetella sp. PMI_491]|nr:putative pyrroline-5-carboxylate reductase [Thozetella sp. PMI_491]